jgi:hypothetical protein
MKSFSSTLPRRLFLRGAAGVTVGLPLLESLGPRTVQAQEAVHRYAVFIRQGNGVLQEKFWPSGDGPITTASLEADLAQGDATVGVLAPFADQLNVVRGIRYSHSGTGCGHADGCFQCLTASTPDGDNSNRTLAMGPSIDWIISQQLDGDGSEPVSLYAGATSSFLGDVILYRGAMERRAGERNPMNAYSRLFGNDMTNPDGDPNVDEQNRIALRRQSVNDIVRAEMQAVLTRPELSMGDRQRLDAHFSAIRDLEVEISTGCQVTPIDDVGDASDNVDEVVRVHMDVIALAMACGKSHAATLSIGNGNDQTQYTVDGQRLERYHHISHRVQSDGSSGTPIPNAEELHHQIDKKFAGYYSYLLEKLQTIQTPTGNLLDDGVVAWLNDLASGPPHGSRDVPWVLAGNAAGRLNTGQFIDGDFTINRILNTVGAAVGVTNSSGDPLDDFGDSGYERGHIPGMLV